mgnify:CR=1 FL=1
MTGKIEARLIELGHPLPELVPPVAAYIPAVATGNIVMTAGQLPFVSGVLVETGKVPNQVSPERAKELAQISALNCLAAIKFAIGDLDRITRIVKVNGFIACDPSFTGQPFLGAQNHQLHLASECRRVFGSKHDQTRQRTL